MIIDPRLLFIHHLYLPVKLFDLLLLHGEILDAAFLPFQHFCLLIVHLTEHPLLVVTFGVLLYDCRVEVNPIQI